MKLSLLCLVTMVTLCTAPFPPDDPRSAFNPFVIPWWQQAPFWFRNALHIHLTGEPLTPERRTSAGEPALVPGALNRQKTFGNPRFPNAIRRRPAQRFVRSKLVQ